MATAVSLILLNTLYASRLGWFSEWTYAFDPGSARAILSAIAGSMITVAGVTFSMTMLTLQLASSQFGPRMLRNFMRDRGNQIVLGTFLSTFVYCLFVLASVRGAGGASFVPLIAVIFGIILAVASLAMLIYFIHHIATSIRIETILAKLADEACQTVEWVFPEHGRIPALLPEEPIAEALPPDFDDDSRSVVASASGYIQWIDLNRLLQVASECDLVVRVEGRVGNFVANGGPLVVASPYGRLSDSVAESLADAFSLGQQRTPDYDIEFSLRRIVEIAQRALSPGVNDPTTALYCLDRLGEVLGLLADRRFPSGRIRDEDMELRVVFEPVCFADLACSAFAAIARYGISDDDLVARLLDVMERSSRSALSSDRETIMHLHDAIRVEGAASGSGDVMNATQPSRA
ncbi:DUF2254 domain-containing protein [Roseovarius nitratireducens]|uniref:DUF2254 domain-containing protein n=1 Tax=Roseovarius nitratireducens TaxID=2044597 RepID=UPI001F0BE4CC|nr:DUF2254 domain-containing protein [Roseovarius nitratireducens]